MGVVVEAVQEGPPTVIEIPQGETITVVEVVDQGPPGVAGESADEQAIIDAAVAESLEAIRAGVDTARDNLYKIAVFYDAALQDYQDLLSAYEDAQAAAMLLKADKSVVVTWSGIVGGSHNLAGDFTINLPEASQAEAQAALVGTVFTTPRRVKDYLDSAKGVAGGVCPLDGGNKIPLTHLPGSILIYKGVWNATTNTPALADGTGTNGWMYRVAVAGTQNLGSGVITYDVGDYVIHNGTAWEKSDTTDAVASVAGKTGNVTLVVADISNLATGVAGWLTSPSSANLRAAITDETGTGSLVFGTNPTITTPTISGNITLSGGQLVVSGASTLAFDFTCYFGSNSPATSRVQVVNGVVCASQFGFLFSSTTAANGTPDAGVSRLGPSSIAIGNGAVGNAAGSLSMAGLTVSGTGLNLTGLATSDPHVAGRAWNNAGVLNISAGP